MGSRTLVSRHKTLCESGGVLIPIIAPTVILELGYSAAQAQLLTIPIYVLGVISTITFSVLADKY